MEDYYSGVDTMENDNTELLRAALSSVEHSNSQANSDNIFGGFKIKQEQLTLASKLGQSSYVEIKDESDGGRIFFIKNEKSQN